MPQGSPRRQIRNRGWQCQSAIGHELISWRPQCGSEAIKTLFITATGTDVGKTTCSVAFLRWAALEGKRLAYWKPVQCGHKDRARRWGDAEWVGSHFHGGIELHTTYRYVDAVSPHLAAARARRPIRMPRLERELDKFSNTDLLLIEGAGGPAVPLDRKGLLFSDFMKSLRVPVLLVCAPGLGTLSHTLCSVDHLRSRGVAPIAFCFSLAVQKEPLAADNAATLQRLTGIPFWGELEHGALSASPSETSAALRRHFRRWMRS